MSSLQHDKLNRYGMMENSILTVHVLQAEDLRATETESKNYLNYSDLYTGGTPMEPYVILAIENQKIETKPTY